MNKEDFQFGHWYEYDIDGFTMHGQFIQHEGDGYVTLDVNGIWNKFDIKALKPSSKYSTHKH